MKHAWLVVLALIVVAGACGKKGDPRAPELATPKLITNLAARTGRR